MSSTTWRSRRRGERPVIYGRDRERAQLRELLDDAIAGHGSLILISGEAGIGKTTLVNDLTQEAAQRHCLVLTGGCYDLTTTPPYGPWTEAIGNYAAPPEGKPLPGWFRNPAAIEKMGSQAQLFEEAREFFAALAAEQPLVIVLEDLHWADAASLDALRYLARRLANAAVLLVASYRDDELTRRHELYQLLPLLVRESQAERVYLNRLDQAAIADLIQEQYELAGSDAERLASYVQERSEGNPFFAGELLRGLQDERAMYQSADGWKLVELSRASVPPMLRSVIERRLERLTEETRQLLEIASVIGYRSSFDLWSRVSMTDDDCLANAVADGFRAQLIEDLPDRSGIQFRHALVRETLYGGIMGVHLRSLHRRVGEALAEQPDADPDQVARHFAEAGDERQVEWLVKAGKRAERSYAWRVAVERYEAAIKLLEREESDSLERGWLLYEISQLLRYDENRRGLLYAEEARRIGEKMHDNWLASLSNQRAGFYRNTTALDSRQLAAGIEQQVEGCQALDEGMRAYWRGTDDPGWLRSISRVPQADLELVRYLKSHPSEANRPLNMRWGATLTSLANWGRLEEAQRLSDELLPVARWALEHMSLSAANLGYADVTIGAAVAHALLGKANAARALMLDAVDAYRRYGHHAMVVHALSMGLVNIEIPYFADEPAQRTSFAETLAIHRDHAVGSAALSYWHVPSTAIVNVIAGRWQDARDIVVGGLSKSDNLMRPTWVADFLMVDAFLWMKQGDLEKVQEVIRRAFPELPDPATDHNVLSLRPSIALQALAAELALEENDLDKSRAWLEVRDHWMDWSGAVHGLAEGQLGWAGYHRAAGDMARARNHAEKSHEHASNPRQPLALIAADRFLGQLDVDEGKYDDAEGRLAASLELAERCEAPFEQALTLVVMAERAAKLGDVDEARRLIARVRQICEPLGAQPTLGQVDEIEALLPRARRSTEEHPFGLTGREVEVLRLVARGRTDAEAAEELFISPRTASQHLRNVYNKLGVSNRAEATRVAVEKGIV